MLVIKKVIVFQFFPKNRGVLQKKNVAFLRVRRINIKIKKKNTIRYFVAGP